MAREGVDALLLGGDGAGVFAGGHRRIGVHMPGWPIPMTVVTANDAPHVITADPDGAEHLPATHVHPLVWNPSTLIGALPEWVGAARSGVVGVDVLSPGGLELARAALPEARFVDATLLLASARLVKTAGERKLLGEACTLANEAAKEGLRSGRSALQAALGGQFAAAPPVLSERRARVSVLVDSFVGEARAGPGDPAALRRAVAELQPGRKLDEVAT
jgi:Xaa-Pro aminopeptidase